MIEVANVGALRMERTRWRDEIRRLNRQMSNLQLKIKDAQKEYDNLGWAIDTLQSAKKSASAKSIHNARYYTGYGEATE